MMYYKSMLIFPLMFFSGLSVATVVPPTDVNTTLTRSFDRTSLPAADIVIWNWISGGYDTDNPALWGRNSLVCFSAAEATNGKCRTSPVWESGGSSQDKFIPLTFTLHNTNVSVDLTLEGTHSLGACGSQFPASHAGVCADSNSETKFRFVLPASELAKIPYPGEWQATLKQKLIQWSSVQVAVWQADITLHVSDVTRQTVYFPAFPSGHAAVNLNLNNRPGTGSNTTASGNSHLDMCLYDGALSADYITLTFTDEGKSAPGRAGGQFSVYRDGGSPAQASDRLDYVLKVLNPTTGSTDTVTNGTTVQWSSINTRGTQRQVVIPGIPGISFCVPAPLSLMTPAFTLADKTAGYYTGKLTVTYTPTTTAP